MLGSSNKPQNQENPKVATIKDLIQLSSLIESQLVENNGELTESLESMLIYSEGLLADKADALGFVLKRLEAGQDYYKTQEQEYKRLSKSCEAGIERIETLILRLMDAGNLESIEGAKSTLKRVLSPGAVVIENEAEIPDEYKITKTEIVIDKRKIQADTKSGMPINGCILQREYRLKVTTTKMKELK
jgi:hypothetical protein